MGARAVRDWSHLALLAALGTGIALYLWDTVRTSTQVQNLILVLPVSLVTLGMIAALFVRTALRPAEGPASEPAGEEDDAPAWHTGAYFVLFAAYVLLLNPFGFDLATALFLLGAIVLKGERRPLVLIAFPLAFAVLCTWAFKHMIAYPLPTLLPYP